MLLAMGLAAFLCIAIGVFPQPLYNLLPYTVQYVPYTSSHVIEQLQILLFSALAFAVLKRTGIYPLELRSINLDTDWLYRGLPRLAWRAVVMPVMNGFSGLRGGLIACAAEVKINIPARWPVSQSVLLVVVLLFSYLFIDFYYG